MSEIEKKADAIRDKVSRYKRKAEKEARKRARKWAEEKFRERNSLLEKREKMLAEHERELEKREDEIRKNERDLNEQVEAMLEGEREELREKMREEVSEAIEENEKRLEEERAELEREKAEVEKSREELDEHGNRIRLLRILADNDRGFVALLLDGPSGAGKSTLIQNMGDYSNTRVDFRDYESTKRVRKYLMEFSKADIERGVEVKLPMTAFDITGEAFGADGTTRTSQALRDYYTDVRLLVFVLDLGMKPEDLENKKDEVMGSNITRIQSIMPSLVNLERVIILFNKWDWYKSHETYPHPDLPDTDDEEEREEAVWELFDKTYMQFISEMKDSFRLVYENNNGPLDDDEMDERFLTMLFSCLEHPDIVGLKEKLLEPDFLGLQEYEDMADKHWKHLEARRADIENWRKRRGEKSDGPEEIVMDEEVPELVTDEDLEERESKDKKKWKSIKRKKK